MRIILGPPGTGKTTTLLAIVEEKLKAGVSANRIGFLSFTKRAAEEAITRACKQFSLIESDFPYFRTLHSLCYRQLGIANSELMKWQHYKELGKRLGLKLTNFAADELEEIPHGDKLLFMEGLARLRMIPLKQQWEESDANDIGWDELDLLARALVSYKEANGLYDFTDMLSRYLTEGQIPELDVLLVDEAQDLSALQWRVVERLMTRAKEVVVAGDDDQAIFKWAGADTDRFINLEGSVTVLDKSYRLNSAVHTIAHNISSRIENRRKKDFSPSKEGGVIHHITSGYDLPLETGKWLVLARHGYQLKIMESHCIREGLDYEFKGKGPRQWESMAAARAYTHYAKHGRSNDADDKLIMGFMRKDWNLSFINIAVPWYEALTRIPTEEMDYIRAALRRDENFLGPPRIRLSTIHGAKGAESDKVAVMLDMSFRTHQNYLQDQDDECRVFYVGVTRAINELYLVQSQSDKAFEL